MRHFTAESENPSALNQRVAVLQSKPLVSAIDAMSPHHVVVFSSPLERAYKSAEMVCEKFTHHLPIPVKGLSANLPEGRDNLQDALRFILSHLEADTLIECAIIVTHDDSNPCECTQYILNAWGLSTQLPETGEMGVMHGCGFLLDRETQSVEFISWFGAHTP